MTNTRWPLGQPARPGQGVGVGWLLLVAVVAVSVLVTGGLVAPRAASAHAAGELPHARLSSDGDTVRVEYTAAIDDLAMLGTALGFLPEGAMRYYLGGPASGRPTPAQIRAFSASEALRTYLLEHVRIRQDGRDCAGSATPAADVLVDGAVLHFRCPDVVTHADVRITLLHELDPLFRTYSVDGTEQFAIHTVAEPEATWDFTLARTPTATPVGLWMALALVVGAIVAVVARMVGRPSPHVGRGPDRRRAGDDRDRQVVA